MSTTYAYTGSVEHIAIGVTGTYAITVAGAQGGSSGEHPGGDGAVVGGDIFLQAGAQLEIVVGGEGALGHEGGGGGGGASLVIETNTGGLNPQSVDITEVVAGGGGGGGSHAAGGVGQTSPTGANGYGAGVVGSFGGGGVNGGFGSGGGGGGGGYTGGAGLGADSGPSQDGSVAGTSFHGGVGGFAGDVGGGTGGDGGFGGGGGGAAESTGGTGGGGGGGGYGGGGGGYLGGGGGGGSFDGGLTAATETAGHNSGNGHITLTLLCFASGTRIRTSRGQVLVEDLNVGDLAVTASGDVRPIKWIGHRRLERPSREHWPVRVMAGALGEGLPDRDLFLSPGHAVCVKAMDEVFVPIGELANGATIARLEVAEVTWWHVELESHDVLLAESLPCESYMDAGNRAWFGRQYGRLAGIDPDRTESLARYARPFVDTGPVVHAIRQRLAARAGALGWTRTADIDLHLMVDGARLEPEVDGGLACFVLPAAANDVRLVSRTFTPGADCRTLGTRIEGLTISDGLRFRRDVPLSEIAGFHPEEAASGRTWRWTTGELLLPTTLWSGCKGRVFLRFAGNLTAARVWLAPKTASARAA